MKNITLFSILCVLISWQSFAQFPESFENAVPPDGWVSFRGTNDQGTEFDWDQTDAFTNSGDFSAYVRYESVEDEAQDWLVTPQFTPGSETNVLEFYQRQSFLFDYGTAYDILVSTTSQTDIGSFSLLEAQMEAQIPFDFAPKYVDLSAYEGQAIYVAFRMTNNDGDNWFIDDVNLVPTATAPNCVVADNPIDSATDVTILGSSLNLSWRPAEDGDAPTSYEFFFGDTAQNLESLGTLTEPNITIINLDYLTTYYWQVIATNSGGSSGTCPVWSFTTGDVPAVPVNDACDNAVVVGSLPFSATIDASSATNNNGFIVAAGCGAGMNDGVWYTFTPATSGVVDIEISNVFGFDPEIALYSGSCNNLICVESADTGLAFEGESLSNVPVQAGTIYFINIGHWSAFSDEPEGAFDISVIGNVTLGLNAFQENQFAYFPNPVKDEVSFEATNPIQSLKVINILGQQVLEVRPNRMTTTLNLSQLETGTYFVQVEINDKSEIVRLIKN